MKEKDMDVFEDEEIVKMYKANIQTAGPDMDKLWNRIEAALEDQEKNDESLRRQKIRNTGKVRIMRIAVTAAAIAVVAFAGAAVYNSNSKIEKDSTNNSAQNNSYSASVDNTQNVAVKSSNLEKTNELNKEENNVQKEQTEQTDEAKPENTKTKDDLPNGAAYDLSIRNVYLAEDNGKVVLAKVEKDAASGKASGWFVDVKGDVYKFSSIDLSDDNADKVLEDLIGKQIPSAALGEDKAEELKRLAQKTSDSRSSLQTQSWKSLNNGTKDKDAVEKLRELINEIEEKL